MSRHNAMLPHGPDAEAFERAAHADLAPARQSGTLAFMFETRLPQHITEFAAEIETLDVDYQDCWAGLKKHFNGEPSGIECMKLASLRDGSRDGRMLVVRRDPERAELAERARTLQAGLDDWTAEIGKAAGGASVCE